MGKLSGTASSNTYGASNTYSYGDLIADWYSQLLSQRDQTADTATEQAERGLAAVQQAGEKQYAALLRQAKKDQTEAKETESGLEKSSGNRQNIGHSQYSAIDQTYDTQRAAIRQAKGKLQTDTARQLSDLQAQGAYGKTDAALSTQQEVLQKTREDDQRVDENLRGNYEYQVGLQREDEETARTQTETERSWLRNLGEMLLSKGVMPTADALNAMGIDQGTAQTYINAVLYGGSGSSGSSGGSSSRRSSSKSSTKSSSKSSAKTTTSSALTSAKPGGGAYSNQAAKRISSYIQQGDYSAAYETLKNAYSAGSFSDANYKLLHKQIASAQKTGTTSTQGTKDTSYWMKYYG
jgi:hypothetical protein